MTLKRLLLLCSVITLLGVVFFACAAPTQTPATDVHEAEYDAE